jgi:hypothetical protein
MKNKKHLILKKDNPKSGWIKIKKKGELFELSLFLRLIHIEHVIHVIK